MATLTGEQVKALLAPLYPGRVQNLRGQSHLEAWDVRRHLIRIFGFGGFDIETLKLDLVHEREKPSTDKDGQAISRWTVVYRAEVRLIIKSADGHPIAHYDDAATGDAMNMPSIGDAHDFAVKTAVSQALKRCSTNLGDQFGLSLYDGGCVEPVVLRTLIGAPAAQTGAITDRDTVTTGVTRDQTPAELLHQLFQAADIGSRADKAAFIAAVAGRTVTSSDDLTPAEVDAVAAKLRERIETPA